MKYFCVLPFCLTLLAGCGETVRPEGELPDLHPARGKVTRAGQPVEGGFLQFRTDAAANNLIVTSVVRGDGSFELSTTHALSQKKAKGAPAGDYSVTYLPPGETQDVMPISVPDPITIASGPNDELTVELGDR